MVICNSINNNNKNNNSAKNVVIVIITTNYKSVNNYSTENKNRLSSSN